MELIVLVLIPSLFIMFFPEPTVASILCIVAGTRLCHMFSVQCRARPIKKVDLWSLSGTVIVLAVIFSVEDEKLRAALIYFALMLSARFIVSLIVHREYGYASTFETMRKLNVQLQRSLELLRTQYEYGMSVRNRKPEELLRHLQKMRRQLLDLEQHYNEQMKVLSARLEKLEAEHKIRLQELEAQREDIQQIWFDLQERFDRVQAHLTQSDGTRFFDPQAEAMSDHLIRCKFEDAFRITERELDIFSPYMSFKLVRLYKPRLKELLSDTNVTIKIRYSLSEPSDARNKITQKVAKMLRKEFKRYPNFKIYRDEVRAKLFICDEKFYVLSNFNVLAYGGECEECSDGEYSINAEALNQYRDRYFRFEGDNQ